MACNNKKERNRPKPIIVPQFAPSLNRSAIHSCSKVLGQNVHTFPMGALVPCIWANNIVSTGNSRRSGGVFTSASNVQSKTTRIILTICLYFNISSIVFPVFSTDTFFDYLTRSHYKAHRIVARHIKRMLQAMLVSIHNFVLSFFTTNKFS